MLIQLVNKLAFHHAGKPRRWVRLLLLRRDKSVRHYLRRIVYRKNGKVRRSFEYWAPARRADAPSGGVESGLQGVANDGSTMFGAEYVLGRLQPIRETAGRWKAKAPPVPQLSSPALADKLGARQGRSRLLIAVGHDDYRKVVGGVQLCAQYEERAATGRGFDYVYLYPCQPLPVLAEATSDPDPVVVVLINGSVLGACRTSIVVAAVALVASSREVRVLVHHLLGHGPEQVAALVRASRHACLFWLHDYFAICPSHTLQRNTLAFCGAPGPESNACRLCAFGEERQLHLLRTHTFFQSVDVDLVAPSQFVADFWRRHSNLPCRSLTVLPHMTLTERDRGIAPSGDENPTVTIGYLGTPVAHKGWDVFRRLITRFGEDRRFRFVVLSRTKPGVGEDAWSGVLVTANDPHAMSRSVCEHEIDLVIHWPTWPETFSFTTFEAMAGSAYVVTNMRSGNVAATVANTKRGIVLADEAELEAFFYQGTLQELVNERRRRAKTVELVPQFSAFSCALLPQV